MSERYSIMDIQQIKQRFGIIGNSPALNRALEVACQVAGTDLSVLITGESGTGKETIPQVIHQNSPRKHNAYFALNCGAIPEGTIDSELFGHEKGSFTSAVDTRKGYFEVADNGTLFLDEVAELPLATQVRLLRVLETGEFIKVGASKVQKTNVRIIAATNVNLLNAIQQGKFREDLYYRLNIVPIVVPPLRERKEDIVLLFRKFAADFAEKYKMPSVQLSPEAKKTLENYDFPGNIRQLKNITEQISVIEQEREISNQVLYNYLPQRQNLPVLHQSASHSKSTSYSTDFANERDLLYKVLFDMKSDVNELKKLVNAMILGDVSSIPTAAMQQHIAYKGIPMVASPAKVFEPSKTPSIIDTQALEEEALSIPQKEEALIRKSLEKHKNRRHAAQELGISERTLYRKIKELGLE
ncbi:sigma-54-dependent Fis family transcriptional regulator [Bacteroidia bacterium]|nr:sigma-54-dependent Fis family transcriptional regulator [Bacteroidia bacterium]